MAGKEETLPARLIPTVSTKKSDHATVLKNKKLSMCTKSEAESALSIHVKVLTNKNKSKVDASITESKETKPRHFRPTVDRELSQRLDCLTDNNDPISANSKVKSAKSDRAYFRIDGEGSI